MQSTLKPIIKVKRTYGKLEHAIGNNIDPNNPETFYTNSTLKHNMNVTYDELHKIDYQAKADIKTSNIKLGKDIFKVLTVFFVNNDKAIYFTKNHYNIGYALIEAFDVSIHLNHDAELAKIINLPEDSSFLSKYQSEEVSLKHYLLKHDSYYERYTLMSYQDQDYLILDAFYPQELNAHYKSVMEENLKNLINYHFVSN